ncbi:MAG: radical SAM protein [Pseudomonadota bacterium]
MTARVLLVAPPSVQLAYAGLKKASIARVHPPLSLPMLAARVRDRATVRILDLNVEPQPQLALASALESFRPTHVGVTGVTPLYPSMLEILRTVRRIDPAIVTIAGGPFVSALPEEVVATTLVDCVVIGEGEETFAELLERPLAEVRGICYLADGAPRRTAVRPPIEDLDRLPLPAWDLYDLSRYRAPVVVERHPPAALVETTRGCPHSCVWCSKIPFGSTFRVKSPERVVEEFLYLKRIGFREAHVEDDGFSENLKHAKEVCRALIAARIDLPWNLLNGIRVDRFDDELAGLLAAAGCYQCGFGIETGNDAVRGEAGKRVVGSDIRRALDIARRHGLESMGYFIMGLPNETEASLRETIEFMCSLPLDYVKISTFVPFPGSRIFTELEQAGRILTRDWGLYLHHDVQHEVFRHEVLTKAVLARYYREAYRRFYLRPPYMLRQLAKGIRKGMLRRMAADFIATKW